MAYCQYDVARILRDWCGAEYVPGEQRKEYKVLCPFHDDHHPSLRVTHDEKFYCDVCGTGGVGMYTFTSLLFGIRGGDWMKILDILYNYQVGHTGEVHPEERPACFVKPEVIVQRAEANLGAARDYYAGNFYGDPLADTSWRIIDTEAKAYMCGRAFLSSTMEHFHVASYRRFPEHSLFFPCVFNGTVHGYVLKAISSQTTPRFLTMPGMCKAEHIYGYCPDRPVVALVVEGFTDHYMAWQYGWTEDDYASFVILGSSVSAEQAAEMAACQCALYISGFDHDEAGEKAHKTLVREMSAYMKTDDRIVRAHWPAKDIALLTKREFWDAVQRATAGYYLVAA